MPKDLAALLVEEGAVPPDAVERARARQREAGGALDTALLEEGAIGEEELLGYLSRAAELPAAPPSAWSGEDARARRVFPSRVAERHGLAPFALDDRELSLVATHPVDLELLDEISFMLSLHLTAHVGPEWRVRELIHRLYGTPLPPRLAALAAGATGGRGEPPAADPAAAAEADPASPAPAPPAEAAPSGPRFAPDDSEPLEPLAAALAQALEAADVSGAGDGAPDAAPGAGEPGPAGDAGQEEEAGEPDDDAPAAPPDRSAPPRWTLEDARAALAAARDRDAVVLAALRYARDFFEVAAMFAVTRDAIAGHDALGPEDARERCRGVAIWASDPGTFRTVVEMRSPHLGPVTREAAGNDAILAGLGRDAPRTALVYPVLLRDRPVCVLYADNGEAPVSARRLGDLLLFLSTVGGAFERIIRARKRRRRRPDARPPPPAEPTGPGEPAAARAAPPSDVEDPLLEVAVDLSDFDDPQDGGGRLEEPPAPPAAMSPPATPDDGAALPPPPDDGPPPPASPHDGAALPMPPDDGAALPVPPDDGAALPASPDDGAALPAPPDDGPALPPPPDDGAAPEARPPAGSASHPPTALADRALDPDPSISVAACAALAARRRDPDVRPALEKLRRALLSGLSARAIRAARALGALRDVDSIPLLIQVLETSEPDVARAAGDALADLTLQRLGTDARRWLGWWKENRGRGRAEWLFSGLTSPDRQTRVAAAVELSLSAPPPVAYSADMPAAEREKAARAWAGWWSRSGHVL